jgi:hypothetical protein
MYAAAFRSINSVVGFLENIIAKSKEIVQVRSLIAYIVSSKETWDWRP